MTGRTKLLKQREIAEDRKTYTELAQELIQSIDRTADEWIPKFCTAIKREHPLMPSAGIRRFVIEDWKRPGGKKFAMWKEVTIRNWWPEWMKNPKNIAAGRVGQPASVESRHGNKSFQNETFDREKDEEEAPVSSQAAWDYEEDHPKIAATPFQLKADVNRAIDRLWHTLTGLQNMPHMEDDVKQDFVIKTRPYFQDIVNGISKVERDFLFNWLTWLNICIKDRIDLVEKADKTAYDRE